MIRVLSLPLQAEQFRQLLLVQLRADDAEAAGVVGAAGPDLVLFRHIVELHPGAVRPAYDALGPENPAVPAGVQGCENPGDIRLGECLGGLPAPGGEDLVGVVVMMMVIVAGAAGVAALVIVAVVVFMPVVIVVMRMFVMIMVMPVPVMVVVLMMMLLVFVVVLVFLMAVVVLVFLMAVVVMVLSLPGLVFRPHLRQQLLRQGHLLHGGEDGLPVQLVPGVVRMAASGFFSRSMITAASSYSWESFWVRERTMVPADSTWLL